MGRLFGWVGPVVYLLAVLFAAASLLCGTRGGGAEWPWAWETSGSPAANVPGAVVASWEGGGGAQAAISAASAASAGGAAATTSVGSVPLAVLGGAWLFALAWFGCQAIVLHPDPLEDERWTAHMMNVAFVSRLVLLPLNVACALVACAMAAFGLGGWFWNGNAAGPAVAAALFVALTGFMLALPAAVYHLCSATRLANREMLGTSGLVTQAVLSFFPLLGFVAMSSLYVNGRASLLAEHDRRVVEDALDRARAAQEQGPSAEEPPAPAGLPGADADGDGRAQAGAGSGVAAVATSSGAPHTGAGESSATAEDAASNPAPHAGMNAAVAMAAQAAPVSSQAEMGAVDPVPAETDAAKAAAGAATAPGQTSAQAQTARADAGVQAQVAAAPQSGDSDAERIRAFLEGLAKTNRRK